MAVRSRRRVDFPMIDAAGIAYYPRIYDLCHRMFEESWEQFTDYTYHQIIDDVGIGFALKHIQSEFHLPIRYGDYIDISISISRIGNSSCTWEYSMKNQDGFLVWTSSQTTVCVDMNTLKPMDIPTEIRKAMEKHLLEV